MDVIRVVGARENNLRDVTVEIPKGRLTAVTGVSGSGKSSLVFDTIAAESRRQLGEMFPAFARNRLPHQGQPDADALENLSAAITMVRQLGSSLTGLTYILDEPSAGLHPHDVDRLVGLLHRLRDKGNTVLVVEHDGDVITAADHVVDLGPGAGAAGGKVQYAGDVAGLLRSDTATGRGLRGRQVLARVPRRPTGELRVTDASLHNLHGVDVSVPLGVLTVVSGVAGSGKSTLFTEVLPRVHPEVLVVDQSPPRGSRRSTPASYLGILDPVRAAFAAANGVPAALFSPNSAGACPACRGRGVIETDLAFLDPVTTVCEACGGSRFSDEALRHRLHGRTIAEVLARTVDEARERRARCRGWCGGARRADSGIAHERRRTAARGLARAGRARQHGRGGGARPRRDRPGRLGDRARPRRGARRRADRVHRYPGRARGRRGIDHRAVPAAESGADGDQRPVVPWRLRLVDEGDREVGIGERLG